MIVPFVKGEGLQSLYFHNIPLHFDPPGERTYDTKAPLPGNSFFTPKTVRTYMKISLATKTTASTHMMALTSFARPEISFTAA